MSPADAYARPAPEPVVKGISAKGPGVHRGELADYAGKEGLSEENWKKACEFIDWFGNLMKDEVEEKQE